MSRIASAGISIGLTGSSPGQLGLKDTSSITKIIQGQREPGAAITGGLIRYFKFSPKDAQYFQDLVRLRKIKTDPRLSVLLLEKMGKDHPDGALRILDDKSFQLLELVLHGHSGNGEAQ